VQERTQVLKAMKRRHRTRVCHAAPLAAAAKELNYLNFVKKVDESDAAPATPGNVSPSQSLIINSLLVSEKTAHKLPEIRPPTAKEHNEPVKPIPASDNDRDKQTVPSSKVANFSEEKSCLSYESYRTEKVIHCMHDEIIVCECCRFPPTATPMVSMNQFENVLARRLEETINEPPKTSVLGEEIQGEGDAENIFHLTTANEEAATDGLRITREKSDFQVAEHYEKVAQPTRPRLRDILIANYDTKLASKIGVGSFVPIEVLNTANSSGKDLEFIPFEEIDQSYPR
jgi:hypothetical protein